MLNIKDQESYDLARAVANQTGESMTGAVRQALRERYERLRQQRRKPSVEELMAIARRAAAQVRRPFLNHARLLYDKHGLPK